MTENQLKYLSYQENARHNLATEELGRDTLAETSRSNLARETETNRSNLAQELETNRSNVAREVENNRSNLAKEQETHRSNVEKERLGRDELGLKTMDSVLKHSTNILDMFIPG